MVFHDRLKDGSSGPDMVVVPRGEFLMGSPEDEEGRDSDERQHRVKIEQPFAMGKYEVTVGEFRRFVRATGYQTEAERGDGCYYWDGEEWKKDANRTWQSPGFEQGDKHPVVCVSWNDAMAYIEWLSGQTGQQYRLPTEAKWEYAARAGTPTARYWGNDPHQGCDYANAADQTAKEQFPGWTIMECQDNFVYTAPTGRYRANSFGLYDVLGNAWEWTCSVYDENYEGAEQECEGKDHAGWRVIRGGSWSFRPRGVRSAYRFWYSPDYRNGYVGFRLARSF